MKKILTILSAAILLYSCQLVDVLDQEPPHYLTPENAITDASSAETALKGIYGSQMAYESYMVIGNHAMTSGILKANKNPGVTVNIYYIESRLPKLSLIRDAYQPFWDYPTTIVNSSNSLLKIIEGMDDNSFKGGRRMSMLGEIHFLRSYYNFELLRMFGEYDKLDSKFGIFLRKEPATASDIMIARSTVQQCYDAILEDIEFAIQHAPDFTSSYYASKTAAKALKIKVLFYMGKYSECLTEANTFIAANERQLVSNYSDIFTQKENSELIFTRGLASSSEVKNQSTRINAYRNQGQWGPTESFLQLVAGDPREDVILRNGVGDVFGSQKTINKAVNDDGDMPIYFMRYSEIYMMKAECEARTNTGNPLATLNLLRSGHGLTTIPSSDNILKTIYLEWLFEMGFENGHEWYATWRMGVDQLLETNETVKKEMDKSADPTLYKQTLPYKRIYAIPSDEISANKLAEQNPGYN